MIEDEEAVSEPLAYMLTAGGYEVTTVANGADGLAIFQDRGADLVLLDIMLPGMLGTDVCREIRTNSTVPIIMISARDDEVDKVVGLELGADDYLTKPFSARELLARIRALLRRRGSVAEPDFRQEPLVAGPVMIDPERHEVTVRGEPTRFPLREFELLEYLVRHAGRVMARGQILGLPNRQQDAGRTRQAAATQDRGRPQHSASPDHGARLGLSVRGLTTGGRGASGQLGNRPQV